MAEKLTPEQVRRIQLIEEFQRAMDHVKKLVAELEANRAARGAVVDNLSSAIARELSQLRQRALTANIGTIADVAGAMSVMASRTAGLNMKIRGLTDGINSITMQLDQALKHATTPAPQPKDKTPKQR